MGASNSDAAMSEPRPQSEEERLGSETAFPLPDGHTHVRRWQAGYGEYRAMEATCAGGLTKREYFAAMAMQGMASVIGPGSLEDIAKSSVRYADALLKELAK